MTFDGWRRGTRKVGKVFRKSLIDQETGIHLRCMTCTAKHKTADEAENCADCEKWAAQLIIGDGWRLADGERIPHVSPEI